MTTYAIRAREYRGRQGWHIGGRGEGGFPTSIFVEGREDAELIRDSLNACRDGHITPEERDAYELVAFHLEEVAVSATRDAFVAAFGEGQAAAIEAAAEEHKNGLHDNPGSDYFRWALVIAIGYECMSDAGYRKYHRITVPWRKLRPWIKNHANLRDHDGDSDYLALFAGTYNYFVGIKP